MITSSFFYRNFFKFIVCFSPVFAVLVSRVKLDRTYFVVSELLLASVTVFLFLDGIQWYPSFDLTVYMLFMMFNLAIFTFKFGQERFSHAVAVSLLLTFIITEAWEFAVVVYAYLGLFGNTMVPIIHPLNHIYVIVCFYFAVKISGFHFTKTNITILLLTLLCSFLFFPPLDVIPCKMGQYNEQFNILRTITFASFAATFYFWSENKNE